MSKTNCWQFRQCGRQPGGSNTKEMGICPASIEIGADGINGGESGGRACWAVAGTLCGGTVRCMRNTDVRDCTECDFYRLVVEEEGDGVKMPEPFCA